MGLDLEECWCRSSSFNWFGHQSRFDGPLLVEWWTGHLASVDIYFLVRWVELRKNVSSELQLTRFGSIVEIVVSFDHHRNCLWKCISFDTRWRWRVRATSLAPRSNAMSPSPR